MASNKATRSKIDFANMTIDSLGLSIKNEKRKGDSTKNDEDNNTNLEETTTVTNKINSGVSEKFSNMASHDLNDQPVDYADKQNLNTVEVQSNPIRKFNGQEDVEQ